MSDASQVINVTQWSPIIASAIGGIVTGTVAIVLSLIHKRDDRLADFLYSPFDFTDDTVWGHHPKFTPVELSVVADGTTSKATPGNLDFDGRDLIAIH